jgi:aryl-alcohol dehydrogenase-like predicted oxidoreductase
VSDPLVLTRSRRLGDTGPDIGPLAYGCWRFTTDDIGEATNLITTALDAGLNLIDTADVYGLDHGGSGFGACEERLGRVLRADPSLREHMILSTKGGIVPPVPYDSSADHIRRACEASLTRLGVDHIDLYQVHRPDHFTHPAELAATLDRLIAEGKVGAVGVSNHTVAQAQALQAHLSNRLVSTQPEYSLLELAPMRDGTFDMCQRDGVLPLAWSPLAGGRLATGEGVSPELVQVLDRLAKREEVDRAAVALAFVLAHPAAPVAIIGTQRPERIKEATAALGIRLDRSDLYELIAASDGRPLP